MERDETQSQMGVPIFQYGKVFGLINIEHPQVDSFSQGIVGLANAMAQLVLIAIEHSKQYEEIKRAKQIIGGRTALVWMNLASAIWYHDIRREAATIRNLITLAREDLRDTLYDKLDERFERMELIYRKFSIKKR